MIIIDYYRSLDTKGKGKFIKDVVELTGMAYSTLFAKLKHNTFKKLEEEAIINYINQTK